MRDVVELRIGVIDDGGALTEVGPEEVIDVLIDGAGERGPYAAQQHTVRKRAAARAGGTAPTVLNAANEVAVQAFLDRRLNFVGISTVIDKVLQRLNASPVTALGDVLEADAAARRLAVTMIELSGAPA